MESEISPDGTSERPAKRRMPFLLDADRMPVFLYVPNIIGYLRYITLVLAMLEVILFLTIWPRVGEFSDTEVFLVTEQQSSTEESEIFDPGPREFFPRGRRILTPRPLSTWNMCLDKVCYLLDKNTYGHTIPTWRIPSYPFGQ